MNHISVGIEITEYHSDYPTASGYSRRVVEQEWEHLRRELMKKVDATASLNGVHGSLFFKDLTLPSRHDHADFINQVMSCAQANINVLPTSLSDFEAFPLLSQYLKEMRFKRIRCHMSWDWNKNIGWIGTEPTALVDCIRRKVKKKYDTEGINDLWLLIVSGPNLSQAMGIDLQYDLANIGEVDELLQKSVFSKAYIFQYMFDVAYEWPTWKKMGMENFRKEHSPTIGWR